MFENKIPALWLLLPPRIPQTSATSLLQPVGPKSLFTRGTVLLLLPSRYQQMSPSGWCHSGCSRALNHINNTYLSYSRNLWHRLESCGTKHAQKTCYDTPCAPPESKIQPHTNSFMTMPQANFWFLKPTSSQQLQSTEKKKESYMSLHFQTMSYIPCCWLTPDLRTVILSWPVCSSHQIHWLASWNPYALLVQKDMLVLLLQHPELPEAPYLCHFFNRIHNSMWELGSRTDQHGCVLRDSSPHCLKI